MTTEIQKVVDPSVVEYVPHGGQDKIKLTIKIVQNLVAVPTKSGKTCSDRDAIKFIAMCQARRLNPFEGDAYLLGFDSKDGVATFSLITAHQAFLKRAELHPEYDGMKSGLILLDENSPTGTIDTEGDFHLPQQKEHLVGGWASVFFKNRKVPTTRRVRLARFQKPFGVWLDDPAGMIVKCAESDALRSSFPTMLGGLYLQQEIEAGAIDISKVNSLELPAESSAASSPGPALKALGIPPTADAPATTGSTKELGEYVLAEGFTLDEYREWGKESGNLPNADSISDFSEVPQDVAKRCLKAKTGLIMGLHKVRSSHKAAP